VLQGDALSIGGQAKKQGRQEEEGDKRRRKKKRAWGWSEGVMAGPKEKKKACGTVVAGGREGGSEGRGELAEEGRRGGARVGQVGKSDKKSYQLRCKKG